MVFDGALILRGHTIDSQLSTIKTLHSTLGIPQSVKEIAGK